VVLTCTWYINLEILFKRFFRGLYERINEYFFEPKLYTKYKDLISGTDSVNIFIGLKLILYKALAQYKIDFLWE